ncbi:MAG: phage head morphogenesis protein [Acinetobacter sp.]|jgi:SPP1 gp7 family putative phage head morphogenesis protein|uniref:phage head morphogenesis protein n=1 Tax=Acinetobacter sp. TaxID=472 RepID=UPI0028319A5D|nr:phage minor head protein [Acinetobacter sp.]MDR2061760.1 phage head morphogenesis protein [Acinetobacter sp.]
MDNMTLLQALVYARSRKVVLPGEYYLLDLNSRQYASTVSGLAGLDQIKSVLNAVYKTVETGGTFQDFQDIVEADGINLSEAQLENVFRTNAQNAYAHGKWLHQQRNKEKRPYLQYMAINDSRVRPSHLALDGVVRHIDDPFWQTYYPPNGYRCRCTTRALTEKQAQSKGITPNDELPSLQLDSGWSFQPSNYEKHPESILDSRKTSQTNTPEEKLVIEDFGQKAAIESEAIDQIKISLSEFDDVKREMLDEMVDKTITLDPNIRPSDLRITLDLADEKENALTNILRLSELQKDQQGTVAKSIWDKIMGAFNRLYSFAKNTANKLTGNSIRGIDDLNLTAGNVIGIKTPTLFREAEKAGKQIIILDAKGMAIDLSKISGLDGVLLAPDLSLEVVSNTDEQIILKRTKEQAVRYFIANQNAFSLY